MKETPVQFKRYGYKNNKVRMKLCPKCGQLMIPIIVDNYVKYYCPKSGVYIPGHSDDWIVGRRFE